MEKTDKAIIDLQTSRDTVTKKVDEMEEAITAISNQMTQAEGKLKQHEKTIEALAKKNKQMDDERKRQNIIVDGIKEEADKHPRQETLKLFADIGSEINADDVTAALWLGTSKQDKN